MEYASVTVQLTIEDVVAFSRFIGEGRSWKRRVLLPGVAIGLCAVFFLLSAAAPPNASSFDSRLFWVVLTTFVLWLLMRFFAGRRLRSERFWKERSPGMFLPNTYRVLDEGLSVENDRGQLLTQWTAIARVAESSKHLYVMETSVRGHAIPKRCFSTSEAAAEFADQVRMQMEKHGASPNGRV